MWPRSYKRPKATFLIRCSYCRALILMIKSLRTFM